MASNEPSPNQSTTATPASNNPEFVKRGGTTLPDVTSGGNAQAQSTDLLYLYQKWVNDYSHQDVLYAERLEDARAGLLADIERWNNVLEVKPENKLVGHHVAQFEKFVDKAYNALVIEALKVAKSTSAELLEFQAKVIGVLTAQWFLLRNVLTQRIAGSPYQAGVLELDQIVIRNYARLYAVFIARLDKSKLNKKYQAAPVAAFAPLAHLGNVSELTVFNHRVPLMLSIPLAALPGSTNAEAAQMAIPHEVSHAIFSQVPELMDELRGKLSSDLAEGKFTSSTNGQELSSPEIVLYRVAIDWTEEICADLWGTALAGEKFATSARWAMATSESSTGITDKTHPPALIRPIVHLLALSTLETDNQRFEDTRQQFEKDIANSSNQDFSLNRRFRSIPALMFVRMETVSTILTNIVKRILETELATLGGAKMADILREIHASTVDSLPSDGELPNWGDDPEITADKFVLDFPAELIPSFTTPGVSILPALPFVSDIFNLIIHG